MTSRVRTTRRLGCGDPEGDAILLSGTALRALRALAAASGRIAGQGVTGVDAQKDKVVLTAAGEQISADRVILTLGPWLTEVAPHNHGPVVGPNDWQPPATDDELRLVASALAELVPGAAGPIVERDVCLYTNTAKADRRLDSGVGGEEFILDRWPKNKRIIIGSACSGHGAKFAPAIGERLASRATERDFRIEPFFLLSRFSGFPGHVDPQIEDATDFYTDTYDLVYSRLWARTESGSTGRALDRQELASPCRSTIGFKDQQNSGL